MDGQCLVSKENGIPAHTFGIDAKALKSMGACFLRGLVASSNQKIERRGRFTEQNNRNAGMKIGVVTAAAQERGFLEA